MGIFGSGLNWLQKRSQDVTPASVQPSNEARQSSGLSQSEMIEIILGGGDISEIFGTSVNASTALALTGVFRAVSVLSSTMAAFPWNIYRRTDASNFEVAYDHPLYYILHDEPHHLWSSFTFREIAMLHLSLRAGNFYAIINRRNGDVDSLRIVDEPENVQIVIRNDQLYYFIPGYVKPFPSRDIFHVRGLGNNSYKGDTPLTIARNTFSEGIKQNTTAAAIFENSARIGGVVTHPAVMTDPQYLRFKKTWQEAYEGVTKSGKTAILEGGATFSPMKINLLDLEFLAQRKFNKSDIALFFGLPPHMLHVMDGATFSNIEHQGIELVKFTFLSWVRRFESEVQRKLIATHERGIISNKMNMDGLLRGDSVARAESLSKYVNSGIMTRDEARAMQDLNALGGYAAELLYPLNVGSEKEFNLKTIENEPKQNPIG